MTSVARSWSGSSPTSWARASRRWEMEEAVERAAAIRPGALYAAAGQAAVRVARGDAAGALPAAERALKIAPTWPLLLDLHADALSRLGRCSEALAEERIALAHTDDFKTRQGPIFYGHINATAGEEMLAGMRARLQRYEQGCAGR